MCIQAEQCVSGATAGPHTSSAAPKATFPAYSQPAPSTAGAVNSVASPATPITSKPATLTTTSATSKLIHPDEDISLVSAHLKSSHFYTVSNVAACINPECALNFILSATLVNHILRIIM